MNFLRRAALCVFSSQMITTLFVVVYVGILSSEKDLEVCGEAKDGSEALQKARELLPDLILLDISMPGMNGLEAARLLRNEVRQAKILVISQHDPLQLLPSVIAAGADGCIDKSRLSADLVASIKKIVCASLTALGLAANFLSSALYSSSLKTARSLCSGVGWTLCFAKTLRAPLNGLLLLNATLRFGDCRLIHWLVEVACGKGERGGCTSGRNPRGKQSGHLKETALGSTLQPYNDDAGRRVSARIEFGLPPQSGLL